MKKNKKWIWIAVGAIVLLIIVSVIRQTSKTSAEKVQTEQVELRSITETVIASGKVYPEVEVKISSDVSGEIVELHVMEGDSVVEGQLLAKIDPDIYKSNVERGVAALNTSRSQLAQAEAQVQNAIAQKEQIEAQLVNAKALYNRNKKLADDGVISTQDFEASEANFRGLEANLKAAEATVNSAKKNVEASQFNIKSSQASLKELQTSLQRTSIFSPTTGIVTKLDVEKGERVVGTIQMTGTEMMRISNLNTMEVQVEVSENDIIRVNMGDETEIEVDAFTDRTFKGKVTQIANSAFNSGTANSGQSLSSDQVSNFVVKVRINPESYADLLTDQLKYPFRPGMSASVTISTSRVDSVLTVPIQSVTTRDLSEKNTDEDEDSKATTVSKKTIEQIEEVVFVVEADTVRMAKVQTGIQDDSFIEIKQGLSQGETIVTGPYSAIARKLKNGMAVEVQNVKVTVNE